MEESWKALQDEDEDDANVSVSVDTRNHIEATMTTTPQQEELSLQEQLSSLTGAEHFLVGLAPHYWAHVPMCIADVVHLKLIHGVNCMILKSVENNNNNNGNNKIIPVSKCSLMGMIVYVDVKSNRGGTTHYVLDDGTGFLDCIEWRKSDHFKLPNLMMHDGTNVVMEDESTTDNIIRIGDLVHIFGRIKVIRVKERDDELSMSLGQEVFHCIREIKITTIQRIDSSGERPRYYCSDMESKHWLKTVTFWKSKQRSSSADDNNENNNDDNKSIIANGVDVLRLLGPKVAQEALERVDFPAADDDVGAWRVFGTSCRCAVPYKQALLYCHCQATSEALDPFFIFRDILLMKLMSMEQEMTNSTDPLYFTYASILSDPDLRQAAQGMLDKSIPTPRLFVKTFAALRNDGIVFLANCETDLYVLVSRSRVMEPHIQRMMASKKSPVDHKLVQLERQSVLQNVPNARIQHVKRCLEKDERKG